MPEDPFGTLISYTVAGSETEALALAQPYIPRGCVNETTMRACTAFGPVEVLASRIEEYAKGGGSKFILRPLCPPQRMLEQLALASEHVIPEYHQR